MKKIIIITLGVVSLFSCEKTLELDAETKSSKLVVNSLFNQQNRWEVEVSRSLSILDEGYLERIDNAVVSIYNEATLISNLTYDGEKYIALGLTDPITSGSKYRVEVSAPNYTSVTAEDICPFSAPISGVTSTSFINSFGEEEYTIQVSFQDQANVNNYYGIELEVSTYSRYYNSSTGLYDTVLDYTDNAYITSIDPIVDNGGADSYTQVLTFKDNLFQGQQKSLTFNYTNYSNPDQFFKRKIKLLSYSESTYNYSKSIEAYRNTEGNPFAEPVQVFSNVEGGFGIFGGRSSSEYEF